MSALDDFLEDEFGVGDDAGSGGLWPEPTSPMLVARQLVDEQHRDAHGRLVLHHHGGELSAWDRCWAPIEDRAVRSTLYETLENAEYLDTTKKVLEVKAWAPTRHKIANVHEALQAVTYLPESVHAPEWIDGGTGPAPGQLVVVRNGILDVTTRQLHPHDPRLFAMVAVPFTYDRKATTPARWLAFLDDLWGDDDDAKAALQEWFGYVLSSRTDLHKILLLVGPTRAGKGVVARVIKALIGAGHVAGPTLASLGQNFGLQPLIGKPLAIIADARLGRGDVNSVTERLLSISGEDLLTIDRKYLEPWSGTLPTRFMVLSNELPRFGDASGAIANRFIVLALTESWLGRENTGLTDQLLPELPGILNWSLDGLQRLTTAGKFTVPASSTGAVVALQDLVSPVSAFVRDRCKVGPEHEVTVDGLYAGWRAWCQDAGTVRVSSKAVFGRDLFAAFPMVRQSKLREGEDRIRVYSGISIRANNGGTPRTTPDQAASKPGGPGWSGQNSNVSHNREPEPTLLDAEAAP